MAEWLRRWTRNPLGSPRAGSNPARDDSGMGDDLLCWSIFTDSPPRSRRLPHRTHSDASQKAHGHRALLNNDSTWRCRVQVRVGK